MSPPTPLPRKHPTSVPLGCGASTLLNLLQVCSNASSTLPVGTASAIVQPGAVTSRTRISPQIRKPSTQLRSQHNHSFILKIQHKVIIILIRLILDHSALAATLLLVLVGSGCLRLCCCAITRALLPAAVAALLLLGA